MRKHYQPSGKYSIISLLYFVLTSLTILPVLGLIYAYCIWYIPFFYINFLITIAFGFGVGFAMMYFVVILGKIRNKTMATVLGALGGLIAMYFHWAVWADLVINAGESYGSSEIGITASNIEFLQVFALAKNPEALFQIIGLINQTGTWGFKSIPVSGIFLAVIWIIETIMVIGISCILPRNASTVPFCELHNEFFKDKKTPELVFIDDKQQLINSLEKDDSAHLESMKKAEKNQLHNHSIFTVYSSKNNEHYVTVENQILKEKGKFDRDEFITYMAISPSLAKILLNK